MGQLSELDTLTLLKTVLSSGQNGPVKPFPPQLESYNPAENICHQRDQVMASSPACSPPTPSRSHGACHAPGTAGQTGAAAEDVAGVEKDRLVISSFLVFWEEGPAAAQWVQQELQK